MLIHCVFALHLQGDEAVDAVGRTAYEDGEGDVEEDTIVTNFDSKEEYTMRMCRTESVVAALKLKLFQKYGLPPEQQWLTRAVSDSEKLLNDEFSLSYLERIQLRVTPPDVSQRCLD